MHKIQFLSADRPVPLREREQLRTFIERLFRSEKKALGGIHYIFCSDDYLLNINRSFLRHDYYTDIITFGLSAPGAPIEAEIYISTDRVKDNARNLDQTIKRELHRVIFHGALHLCGYKDKSKKDIAAMRAREDHYLGKYLP